MGYTRSKLDRFHVDFMGVCRPRRAVNARSIVVYGLGVAEPATKLKLVVAEAREDAKAVVKHGTVVRKVRVHLEKKAI